MSSYRVYLRYHKMLSGGFWFLGYLTPVYGETEEIRRKLEWPCYIMASVRKQRAPWLNYVLIGLLSDKSSARHRHRLVQSTRQERRTVSEPAHSSWDCHSHLGAQEFFLHGTRGLTRLQPYSTVRHAKLQTMFLKSNTLPLSLFVGWGETESSWYDGHQRACCTSPGW
jgi:hypothetical protein